MARRCAQARDQVSCPRVWPPKVSGAERDAANGAESEKGSGAGSGRELSYHFDLASGGEAPGRVHITLELRMPASGREVVTLPSDWAETTELERGIDNLAVSGGGARLLAGPAPSLRVLRAAPGAPVQLSYDLVGGRGVMAGAAERHRVLLRPGLVEFNGSNGLVAPAMAADARVHVRLKFTGLPAGQTVVTSFGEGEAEAMTGAWREVREALFVGGALRTRELVVEGMPVMLAIVPPPAGDWTFSDEDAAVKVRRILATERLFWRDLDIPWYAVVIAPMEGLRPDGAMSVGGGGTAFTHAFLLSLAPREGFGTETESLFAHEAFHEWNPLGLGSGGRAPAPEWFTEGVTTFYQDRLLERAKLLDPEEYLRRVNRIVRDDRFLREARVASNARLTQGARVTSPAQLDAEATTYRGPYLRGALMAMWLDAEIRGQTKGARSLDDVMLALRADREQPLTQERVLHTAAYLVDAATVERLRGFAERDAEVPFYEGGLARGLAQATGAGRCVEVRTRVLWSFDLGLDSAELRHGAVLGSVREGSAAWRAGLRNGETLEGWEMVTGDADHEVVMMVRGPGGRASVHYLPRGEQVSVPQAEMVAGCDGAGKL